MSSAFTRRSGLLGITAAALLAATSPMTAFAGTWDSPSVTTRRRSPVATGTALSWLSGAGDDVAGNIAGGGFGRWRGEPATYARIWCDQGENQTQIWMLDAFTQAGWTGTVDIANGGPSDWTTAATGSMDATWTAFCRTLHAKWGKLAAVHLSMAHELNGDWYPWSVRPGMEASFKKAWIRWHGIVTRELIAKGRNVKFCLSYNSDSLEVPVQALYPGAAYVDVIGTDFYNMWLGTPGKGNLHTQAEWDAHRNDKAGTSPRGIQAWFDFAKAMGKPISFPEWGSSPQNFDDSPFFIESMNKIFRANAAANPAKPAAGQVAGEAYFNTHDECRLYGGAATRIPRSAAKYKELVFGR